MTIGLTVKNSKKNSEENPILQDFQGWRMRFSKNSVKNMGDYVK